jgi:hypothetical protein
MDHLTRSEVVENVSKEQSRRAHDVFLNSTNLTCSGRLFLGLRAFFVWVILHISER